jgi:hypothetical protein
MLRIKADRMNDLEKFGFEDWGKYYALNPNVYSNSPLKGLFTCRNVFVDKDTRKFSCGFINYETESVFNALNKADMVEEVTE